MQLSGLAPADSKQSSGFHTQHCSMVESRIEANVRCMERLGRKVRGEIGAQLSKMVSQDLDLSV